LDARVFVNWQRCASGGRGACLAFGVWFNVHCVVVVFGKSEVHV
jgi:hypothetical protein